MKKIIIYTALVAAWLLPSGCDLDFEPTSAVSNSTLTENDYQALLTGVYDGAQSLSIIVEDVAADNLNSPSWLPSIDQNNYTSTDGDVNSYWESYYGVVQLANNLVNLIEAKATKTDADLQMEAQARVLRAWVYTRITGFWGDAPLVLEVSDAAVPRSPEVDIWKQIVADLEYGVEHAPAFTTSDYVSRTAAKALLARTLLIAPEGVRDLSRAHSLAEELIADGTFALADDPNDIWQTRTSKEMIFAWENISGDSGAPGWWLRSNLVNTYNSENGAGAAGYGELGRYEYPVDMALYRAYEDGDLRKAATIRHLQLKNGNETYDIIKYPSYDGADPVPVVRIAEMYLVSAEAAGYPAGVSRLNQLRVKRGLPALVAGTDITADNFESRIMQERRVEFAAEGLRWYDLRRWFNSGAKGKAEVLKLRKYQAGEAAGSRPGASDDMDIADDGYNLLWPVPATAIQNDPNLLPNNPGY